MKMQAAVMAATLLFVRVADSGVTVFRLADTQAATATEALALCQRALPAAGGKCDADGYQGKIDKTVEFRPGIELHADGTTMFEVTIHDGSDVLHLRHKDSIICEGSCVGVLDNTAMFVLRPGAKVGRVISTVHDPHGGLTTHIILQGVNIAAEWNTQCDALIDLVNISDRSSVRDLVLGGAFDCDGLRIRTDPVEGGAVGPLLVENATIGLTSRYVAQDKLPSKTRPIVIETAGKCGFLTAIELRTLTVGHAAPGQPAITIDGHGCGGIQGISIANHYCEPLFTDGVCTLIRDAQMVSINGMTTSSACSQPCQWRDFVRIEESVRGNNFGIDIRNVRLNMPAKVLIHDVPVGRQISGYAAGEYATDDNHGVVITRQANGKQF